MPSMTTRLPPRDGNITSPRFPIPYKLRFAVGFMCKVDYDHELANTTVPVYPSLKALREAHPSWPECGIVKVEVRLLEVISESTHD